MFKRVKVKKGDTVKVISGGNRGKEGTVLSVDRKKDRVVVEGVNIVTKHVKPSPTNPQADGLDSQNPQAGLSPTPSELGLMTVTGKATSHLSGSVAISSLTVPEDKNGNAFWID